LPQGSKLRAVIGPHAGFTYSGPTAGWAYKNIDATQYDRVVLLGPSHKVHLDFLATTACTEWATPLGNIQVDTAAIDNLIAESGQTNMVDKIQKRYEENEHSLEMHIPFI
jgi:MEMO1 family protein